MLEYLNSRIIFGIALCLITIALLDSHADAYALKSHHDSSSSEESSEESGRNSGWDRDWDDWNRNRDKNKNKKKFKCPSSYGNFADIEDCSAFFACQQWKPKWKSCSRNKRFDRYRRTCLPFIIAVCDDGKDDKKTTKGEIGTTTPKEDSFTCPSFLGTFPDPNDCSKYYDCSFYIPSLKICPKKQLFDGIKKKCKPEGEVNCGSRKRPTTGTTPVATSTEPTKPTTPQPTTKLPSTLQPTTTTPQPTTTPPTTPQPTTTPPTTPQPATPPQPTTTTSQPTTTPPTTPPQPTTTPPTTPQPTTTPVTSPIPTGPPETDCDEDDLDCIIKETGEIPQWFKCPEAVGAYRHPSSGKLFIFCKNWKPYVKKCGQDLVYSDEMRTCITP